MAEKDRERLARAWEIYQWRRRRADERRRRADKRRLEENERALDQLSKTILKLREEGYSLSDVGRELGKSRQGVYDLLRRARRPNA
jgi:DNA-binding CsgD family transcriptional regulator